MEPFGRCDPPHRTGPSEKGRMGGKRSFIENLPSKSKFLTAKNFVFNMVSQLYLIKISFFVSS